MHTVVQRQINPPLPNQEVCVCVSTSKVKGPVLPSSVSVSADSRTKPPVRAHSFNSQGSTVQRPPLSHPPPISVGRSLTT